MLKGKGEREREKGMIKREEVDSDWFEWMIGLYDDWLMYLRREVKKLKLANTDVPKMKIEPIEPFFSILKNIHLSANKYRKFWIFPLNCNKIIKSINGTVSKKLSKFLQLS